MFALENKKYNLVRCSQCNLVFARPIYSEEQLEAVYRTLYSQGGSYNRHLQELKDLREGHSVNIGYNKR